MEYKKHGMYVKRSNIEFSMFMSIRYLCVNVYVYPSIPLSL